MGGCGNAQMGPESRWEVKDDFSYLMRSFGGTHQWKVGFDFNYIPFEGDNTGAPLGSWTFPRDVPYDANDRTTWPTLYTNNLPTYANIPVWTYAAYVQDDWQLRSGLTFNLGLRYDLQTGSFNEDVPELLGKIEDKLGRDGSFPFDVSIFPQPRPNRGDKNNFGPRLGMAWDPANNGVTNIHAAYGLFYDNMRTLQNFGELTWPQAKPITIQNPSYPDPFGGRTRESFLSTTPPTVTVGSNGQVNMYAHQYNVGMNRHADPRDRPVGRLHHRAALRRSRLGRDQSSGPDDESAAVPDVRARELLAADGGQHLQGAAPEGREAHVAALSGAGLVHAQPRLRTTRLSARSAISTGTRR